MNKIILQDLAKYNSNPSDVMFDHIENETFLTLSSEILGLIHDNAVINGMIKFITTMLQNSIRKMQEDGKIESLVIGYDMGHGIENLADNPSLPNYTHILIILIYSILKEKEHG